MLQVKSFIFNPFQENTYIVYDETKECVIIDPGCYSPEEKEALIGFIEENDLTPVKLLNTHCHLDHIFGNKLVVDKFGIELHMHKEDVFTLESSPQVGREYGIPFSPSPDPEVFLEEGDVVTFGNSSFEILFTPGHSLGSITFCHKESKQMFCGDVLFHEGIGRFDFPGGDEHVLMNSILNKLFPLGDDWVVHSGHGKKTTIGHEKKKNPFVLHYESND